MWFRKKKACQECGRTIAIVDWGSYYTFYVHKSSIPFGRVCLNNGVNGWSWLKEPNVKE